MRFLEIVLEYDIFTIYRDKNTDEYFVLNNLGQDEYEWVQVELCGVVADCSDYDTDVLIGMYDNDFCGEDLHSENYLYFKRKRE